MRVCGDFFLIAQKRAVSAFVPGIPGREQVIPFNEKLYYFLVDVVVANEEVVIFHSCIERRFLSLEISFVTMSTVSFKFSFYDFVSLFHNNDFPFKNNAC